MTFHHLLRTTCVAGVAALAITLSMQARAEEGDNSVVVLVEESAPAEETAAAETTVAASPDAAVTPGEVATIDLPVRAKRVSTRARAAATDQAKAEALRPLIERHAAENGIPFGLADAIVRVESRYNAGARNGPNLGLTQINAGTARSIGYQGSAAGLFDPETNLRYGLKYLARAYQLADGDTCGTILRYQAGHRAQTMTRAARLYCAKVQTIIASAQ